MTPTLTPTQTPTLNPTLTPTTIIILFHLGLFEKLFVAIKLAKSEIRAVESGLLPSSTNNDGIALK